MANNRWEPKAAAVQQVDTITVALTWATADTVAITINTKVLTVSVGTDSATTDVAIAVKEAINGETFTDTTTTVVPTGAGPDIAEFSELTATVSGSVVTVRGIAGEPFVMTVVETTAGDGTAVEATATAATGPNHYDNSDNWSSSVPIGTDDVYVDNSDVSILWGLDQSAVPIASFTEGLNFTGDIGLPEVAPGGYKEYRESGGYLQLNCAKITIGTGEGSGSGRTKIDTGSSTAAIIAVINTGSSSEFGLPAFLWKGTHASSTLDMLNGSVGVASFGGELATLTDLVVADGTCELGVGLTLATMDVFGGTCTLRGVTSSTITMTGGVLNVEGTTGTISGINQQGGTINYRAGGTTITTLTVGGEGSPTFDLTNCPTTVTATNPISVRPGANIVDPSRKILGDNVSTTSLVTGITVT